MNWVSHRVCGLSARIVRGLVVVAIVALGGMAVPADGSVVVGSTNVTFTTFGPNYGSNAGGYLISGPGIGSADIAAPFIAPATGAVENITVGTGYFVQPHTGSHTVNLYASLGGTTGLPGTSLFNFASPFGTVQNGSAGPYFSFDIGQGPELIAGNQYWIHVQAQDQFSQHAWHESPTAPATALAHINGLGSWTYTQVGPQVAFSVTMVPEPAGLGVAMLAGAGLLARRRRV